MLIIRMTNSHIMLKEQDKENEQIVAILIRD